MARTYDILDTSKARAYNKGEYKMTIKPYKSSNFDSMTSEGIARDIKHHAFMLNSWLEEVETIDLAKKDRTQLKAIASELYTIEKRLNWILYNRY